MRFSTVLDEVSSLGRESFIKKALAFSRLLTQDCGGGI